MDTTADQTAPVRREDLQVSAAQARPFGALGATIAGILRTTRPEMTADLERQGVFLELVAKLETMVDDQTQALGRGLASERRMHLADAMSEARITALLEALSTAPPETDLPQ